MKTHYTVVIVTYNRKALLEECVSMVNNQSVPASHVVIVNNASTDGTDAFLEELLKENKNYFIVNCDENIGGAGGFAKGIEYALQWDDDYILIIDDDAIIAVDYMEKILEAAEENPKYKAFAGTVLVNGDIDMYHRRTLKRVGFLDKTCGENLYNEDTFECDIVSFCGMVVSMDIVREIGLPHAHYFITHDDVEYSLRVKNISRFLVVTAAQLNHKTKVPEVRYPRRYNWRDYYAIRNRILYCKEHGNIADIFVNRMYLFANVVFRNWLFGILKKDNYDWKYEKEITKKAIKDANSMKIVKAEEIKEQTL